jgi:hypothetical protein
MCDLLRCSTGKWTLRSIVLLSWWLDSVASGNWRECPVNTRHAGYNHCLNMCVSTMLVADLGDQQHAGRPCKAGARGWC